MRYICFWTHCNAIMAYPYRQENFIHDLRFPWVSPISVHDRKTCTYKYNGLANKHVSLQSSLWLLLLKSDVDNLKFIICIYKYYIKYIFNAKYSNDKCTLIKFLWFGIINKKVIATSKNSSNINFIIYHQSIVLKNWLHDSVDIFFVSFEIGEISPIENNSPYTL